MVVGAYLVYGHFHQKQGGGCLPGSGRLLGIIQYHNSAALLMLILPDGTIIIGWLSNVLRYWSSPLMKTIFSLQNLRKEVGMTTFRYVTLSIEGTPLLLVHTCMACRKSLAGIEGEMVDPSVFVCEVAVYISECVLERAISRERVTLPMRLHRAA